MRNRGRERKGGERDQREIYQEREIKKSVTKTHRDRKTQDQTRDREMATERKPDSSTETNRLRKKRETEGRTETWRYTAWRKKQEDRLRERRRQGEATRKTEITILGEMRNRNKEKAVREQGNGARGDRCPVMLTCGCFSVAKSDLRHSKETSDNLRTEHLREPSLFPQARK